MPAISDFARYLGRWRPLSATDLRRSIDRLADQVGHWQPARWAAPAPGRPDRSRGDLVHQLVQRLADLAADSEGEPRRPVPRLDTDLVLPDQLRVVAADLLAGAPPPEALAAEVTEVNAVRRAL